MKIKIGKNGSDLIKDTSIIAFSRIFMMLFNIGLISLFTSSEYGKLAYFDTISQFCLSISNFGLTTVLIKDLQLKNKGYVLSNFLAIKIVGIFIIAGLWHAFLIVNKSASLNFIGLNFVYTMLMCVVFDWYLIGTNRAMVLAKYYIVNIVVLLSGTLVLYLTDFLSIYNLRTLQIVSIIISVIFIVRVLIKEFGLRCLDLKYIKSILKQGSYMLGIQGMQNTALTVLVSVIKGNLGYSGLAPFSVALRLCQVIIGFRNMVTGPITKFLMNKGMKYYKSTINRYYICMIIIYILSILFLYVCDGLFISSLWNDRIVINILLLLSIVPFINILLVCDGIIINIYGMQHLSFVITAAAFMIFLVLLFSSLYVNIYYYALVYVIFEVTYILATHFLVVRRVQHTF